LQATSQQHPASTASSASKAKQSKTKQHNKHVKQSKQSKQNNQSKESKKNTASQQLYSTIFQDVCPTAMQRAAAQCTGLSLLQESHECLLFIFFCFLLYIYILVSSSTMRSIYPGAT